MSAVVLRDNRSYILAVHRVSRFMRTVGSSTTLDNCAAVEKEDTFGLWQDYVRHVGAYWSQSELLAANELMAAKFASLPTLQQMATEKSN